MRKQQRFSLHCLPGCGTIAVLRQGSTTMKTTAMTAEERVRYMTQAPVRRLILEMSAPTVILCTMLLQTIGMAWQASVVAAARQGLFLIPVVFILPNLLGLAGVEYASPPRICWPLRWRCLWGCPCRRRFAVMRRHRRTLYAKNRNMEEKYVSTCFTFYRRSAVPD